VPACGARLTDQARKVTGRALVTFIVHTVHEALTARERGELAEHSFRTTFSVPLRNRMHDGSLTRTETKL